MCQSAFCPPFPPTPSDLVYIDLMNKNETAFFFCALHALEAIDGDASPLYIEGYDYIMDIVKDAIFDGEDVKDMYDLDNFINQADAYAEDYEGDYAKGYQDAVNICLEAVSQLIESDRV